MYRTISSCNDQDTGARRDQDARTHRPRILLLCPLAHRYNVRHLWSRALVKKAQLGTGEYLTNAMVSGRCSGLMMRKSRLGCVFCFFVGLPLSVYAFSWSGLAQCPLHCGRCHTTKYNFVPSNSSSHYSISRITKVILFQCSLSWHPLSWVRLTQSIRLIYFLLI